MALTKLDSLYKAVILDHSTHPHHKGSVEGEEPLELNNPTCGDVVYLSVKIEDGKISDIAFDGSGCTISTASSSMMTDAVIGKTLEEALQLADEFSHLVQGEEVEDAQNKLGEAAFLSGVSKFPQRIKCSTLAWNALKKVLKEKK